MFFLISIGTKWVVFSWVTFIPYLHIWFVFQQVLNSFKDELPLSAIKKDIEANFKQIKMSLVAEEEYKQQPQLPAQYISW